MKTDLSLSVYYRNGLWLFELEGVRVDGGTLPARYILETPDKVLATAARGLVELWAVPVTVFRSHTMVARYVSPYRDVVDVATDITAEVDRDPIASAPGADTMETSTQHDPDPADRDLHVIPSTPLVGFQTRAGANRRATKIPETVGTYTLPNYTFVGLGRALYRHSRKKNDSMLYGRDLTQIWLSDYLPPLRAA